MKKSLLTMALALGCITNVYAKGNMDNEVAGKVKNINVEESIVVIQTPDAVEYSFAVTPMTEIEYEDRFFDGAEFEDIEVNNWIKVDYIPGKNVHSAEEISIYED